jgi:hypothetical protein
MVRSKDFFLGRALEVIFSAPLLKGLFVIERQLSLLFIAIKRVFIE